nr:MerR family DNA-binding transcriptional regulator [Parvibium lacunae]
MFSISQLAAEFDLTPRALRFYEDHGIVAPQREGTRRLYSVRDRARLKLTLRGKRLGLSLGQIRELIDMYESPKDTLPQLKRLQVVLQQQAQALSAQLSDLQATLSEIQTMQAECERLLSQRQKRR